MSILMDKRFAVALLGSSLLFPLFACQQETPVPVERIRVIKTIMVTERAAGLSRKFPGVVQAVDSTSLSFEVSGNVNKLHVETGDKVSNGQILAELDPRPFQLNVQAAEAELRRTTVDLENKKKNLERLTSIAALDSGAVSARSLDQARAAYESAQQTVSYAGTKLNLVRRDLKNTRLLAPFDGIIAKRHVDGFQEVTRGQPIYDVFIQEAMQVVIDIPESLIDDIYVGLDAGIRFPREPDHTHEGVVSEISSVAGGASTFPVKVTLKNEGGNIRPGMSADVSLLLPFGDQTGGYLLPIHAFTQGDEQGLVAVFRFEAATATVKKTPVTASGAIDNNVVVTQGIKPGDIVAVAGVSFLRDGQKVKLMKP